MKIHPSSPKIHTVEHLEYDSIMEIVEQNVENKNEDTVLLRVFDKSRLSRVLATGTDRSVDSTEYECAGVDATSADRKAAGIDQGEVIYAHEIDLSGPTPFRHSHSYALLPLERGTPPFTCTLRPRSGGGSSI